jgi:hypothetical protein
MQHRLNITIGTSPVWEVQAETPLGPSLQLATPETITGTLLNPNANDMRKVRDSDTVVGFEGYPYRFARLDEDGSFTLTRIMAKDLATF